MSDPEKIILDPQHWLPPILTPCHPLLIPCHPPDSLPPLLTRVAGPCHFEADPAPAPVLELPIFLRLWSRLLITCYLHAWVRWGRIRPAVVFLI